MFSTYLQNAIENSKKLDKIIQNTIKNNINDEFNMHNMSIKEFIKVIGGNTIPINRTELEKKLNGKCLYFKIDWNITYNHNEYGMFSVTSDYTGADPFYFDMDLFVNQYNELNCITNEDDWEVLYKLSDDFNFTDGLKELLIGLEPNREYKYINVKEYGYMNIKINEIYVCVE